MCGRYTVYTDGDFEEMKNIVLDVESRLTGPQQLKTGEIFPTNLAPVITPGGAVPMSWGFPRWDGKGVVINARGETALEKAMFRQALMTRRLAVPSTGFFEWKHTEGKKQKDKFWIRLQDAPMLYMAGIYTLFRQPEGNEEARFVILTTAANESMAGIHDRMPVILRAEEVEPWISDNHSIDKISDGAWPHLKLERVS